MFKLKGPTSVLITHKDMCRLIDEALQYGTAEQLTCVNVVKQDDDGGYELVLVPKAVPKAPPIKQEGA